MNPRLLSKLLTAALLSTASLARPQESYPVAFEGNVAMVARDGVKLRADIYRPKADGKFPVLLERTPYNK
jgi:predicted acyl esterase